MNELRLRFLEMFMNKNYSVLSMLSDVNYINFKKKTRETRNVLAIAIIHYFA